jgi:hypothetical protein
MTKYRGYIIEKQIGSRDTWYNVILNGEIVHRAATEYAAMQWIDQQ